MAAPETGRQPQPSSRVRSPAWQIESVSGTAAELHAGSGAALRSASLSRTARIMTCEAPALVLGSHQHESGFDTGLLAGLGVAVARRPSGGSAVLVGPSTVVWVDFLLPSGDPLWDDDIRRASRWVGELWREVLSEAGVAGRSDLEVWSAGLRKTAWSSLICFAGLGPGEVTLQGRKVVGLSQRRTRSAALFQTSALLEWDPAAYTRVLASPPPASTTELAESAEGLGVGSGPSVRAAVVDALLA